MGARRIGRAVTAAAWIALSLPGPLAAADAPTCAALGKLIADVDAHLADWSDSARANRMALARLSISAVPALAHARDAGEAPEIVAAVTALRDLGRTEEGQPVPPVEDLRARLLGEGMVLAAALPGMCPGQAVPDLARHAP